MKTLRIVHLVDDTQAGGVMRMLDYLMTLPQLAAMGDHDVQPVSRQALSFGRIEADVIVSHLTLSWRGLPALMTLRAMHPNTRLIHIEHSYTSAFTALNVAAKRRFCGMLRVGYALFDTVVAVSKAQARWMTSRDLVDAAHVQVIPPQVDLRAFDAVPAAKGHPCVIGAIGRLDHQKGFDVLIDAVRLSPDPDLRLVIFGEGALGEALRAQAKGDNRIRFAGHATDPVQAFKQVDVIAMPSRWEAYGIVAREAIAAGRHLIASDTDGLAGLPKGRAISVEALTADAWAAAIATVRTHPAPHRPATDRNRDADLYAARWQAVLQGPGASEHETAQPYAAAA